MHYAPTFRCDRHAIRTNVTRYNLFILFYFVDNPRAPIDPLLQRSTIESILCIIHRIALCEIILVDVFQLQ